SLNSAMPRYFIERCLGEGNLGIFAAMAYLTTAGGMVVNALGQSSSPRLARYCSERNGAAFRSLLIKVAGTGLLLGLAGAAVAALFGRELLSWLYSPEYGRQSGVLV